MALRQDPQLGHELAVPAWAEVGLDPAAQRV